MLLVGAAATALFVWIEPRCLRGPYAMMDSAVWPIWLAHVREMKPLIALTIESPLTGIAIATFPAAAAIAALVLARSGEVGRDFGFLTATAAFAAAAVLTLAAVKSASYAAWLAMPLVAAFALHLFRVLRLQSLVPRAAVAVLLTPAVLSLGAITIANAAGLGANDSFNRAESDACFKTESYAAMARLAPGIVAADIDYGSFLLALTPHTVLAAPYHRLSAGIITVHEAFSSPPEQARRILARHRVDYVMTCKSRPYARAGAAQAGTGLWEQLHAGAVPDWLEAMPVTKEQSITVYRVRS
jgi:hypothetical protein